MGKAKGKKTSSTYRKRKDPTKKRTKKTIMKETGPVERVEYDDDVIGGQDQDQHLVTMEGGKIPLLESNEAPKFILNDNQAEADTQPLQPSTSIDSVDVNLISYESLQPEALSNLMWSSIISRDKTIRIIEDLNAIIKMKERKFRKTITREILSRAGLCIQLERLNTELNARVRQIQKELEELRKLRTQDQKDLDMLQIDAVTSHILKFQRSVNPHANGIDGEIAVMALKSKLKTSDQVIRKLRARIRALDTENMSNENPNIWKPDAAKKKGMTAKTSERTGKTAKTSLKKGLTAHISEAEKEVGKQGPNSESAAGSKRKGKIPAVEEAGQTVGKQPPEFKVPPMRKKPCAIDAAKKRIPLKREPERPPKISKKLRESGPPTKGNPPGSPMDFGPMPNWNTPYSALSGPSFMPSVSNPFSIMMSGPGMGNSSMFRQPLTNYTNPGQQAQFWIPSLSPQGPQEQQFGIPPSSPGGPQQQYGIPPSNLGPSCSGMPSSYQQQQGGGGSFPGFGYKLY